MEYFHLHQTITKIKWRKNAEKYNRIPLLHPTAAKMKLRKNVEEYTRISLFQLYSKLESECNSPRR
jgi:hypothetical protein